MKRMINLLVIGLWAALMGIYPAQANVQDQLKIEVNKNLVSISAKNEKLSRIAKAIEEKCHVRVKVFEGVQDKTVSIDLSNMPVYDIRAILEKIGYTDVAVVFDKKDKARADMLDKKNIEIF